MADKSEKVSEEMSFEKKRIQGQMLPPALPLKIKVKTKKTEAPNITEKSSKIVQNNEMNADGNDKKRSHESDDEKRTLEKQVGKEAEGDKTSEENSNMLPPNIQIQSENIEKSKKELEKDNVKKEIDKKQIDKKDYPDIPYSEPSWAGMPQDHYYLELLKGGCIISTIRLTSKSYYLFGRLPNCDMVMEHPSISRYHAIIQYKSSDSSNGKRGFYLYDLGSTHGTKVNKISIQPKRYYRLQVGYVIKFGGSTRLYILQGPEDLEAEEDSTSSEKQQENAKTGSEVGKVMTEAEFEEWKKEKDRKPEEASESCSWGFGEDAVEEDAVNPFASELDEEIDAHVFKDPKKTLRGFFEREGLELEYQVEETGPGHARVYHCRVKLPIEDANGDPLYAEAAVTGKKREAVLACAAEACRILDVNGLLRQSSHESKKQKLKNWAENDYYDSDEDTFLDRTGSIEKKRLKRMKMVKKDKEEVETFESLSTKLMYVEDEIKHLEAKLEEAVKASKAAEENEDSLESYMKNIDNSMDRTSRMKMRRKIFELKKEKQKLSKLVEISRPANLPSLVREPQSTLPQENNQNVIKTKPDISGITEKGSETIDPSTTTRQEEAKTLSENKLTESTGLEPSESNTEESKRNDKESSFICPNPPSSAAKHKTAPSSSISSLLEGLKEGKEKPKERKERKKKLKHEEGDVLRKKAKHSCAPPSQTNVTLNDSSSSEEETHDTFDENYMDWIPPSDQTGDGKTKLNEKYGY